MRRVLKGLVLVVGSLVVLFFFLLVVGHLMGARQVVPVSEEMKPSAIASRAVLLTLFWAGSLSAQQPVYDLRNRRARGVASRAPRTTPPAGEAATVPASPEHNR